MRAATAQAYADLLNAGITPVVREYGSLGCSGDLAPLAHCALAAMGEGEVRDAAGELLPAGDALQRNGIEPVVLAEKEGLALINGTDGMLGMLVLACADLRLLLRTADITAAMSVEALLGTDAVFAADLQALRPHPGQARQRREPARAARRLGGHGQPPRPGLHQGAGRVLAALLPPGARGRARHRRPRRDRRRPASSPAPSTTRSSRWTGGWRATGTSTVRRSAYVLDFLAIAVADLASISERRTDRFLDVARNAGLPPFLADDPGVDCGHMIAQYTQAAIVSELKRLAVPASVDSIPSLGDAGGPRLDGLVGRPQAAARRRRADPGAGRRAAHRRPRPRPARAPDPGTGHRRGRSPGCASSPPGPGPDRYLAPEIEAARQYVTSGGAVRAAESVTGPLA